MVYITKNTTTTTASLFAQRDARLKAFAERKRTTTRKSPISVAETSLVAKLIASPTASSPIVSASSTAELIALPTTSPSTTATPATETRAEESSDASRSATSTADSAPASSTATTASTEGSEDSDASSAESTTATSPTAKKPEPFVVVHSTRKRRAIDVCDPAAGAMCVDNVSFEDVLLGKSPFRQYWVSGTAAPYGKWIGLYEEELGDWWQRRRQVARSVSLTVEADEEADQ